MPESAAARLATETDQPTVNPEPRERECLRCYLMRMLDESGCDGSHRWTLRWQRARAPRASGLVSRLRRQGGYCDCEVIFNAMPDYPEVDGILPCSGVPEGSTRPCDLRGTAGPPVYLV
jgi:hypothetical protein